MITVLSRRMIYFFGGGRRRCCLPQTCIPMIKSMVLGKKQKVQNYDKKHGVLVYLRQPFYNHEIRFLAAPLTLITSRTYMLQKNLPVRT